MSQNAITYNFLKTVQIVLLVQVIAVAAQASGTCLVNKTDISEDMKTINERLILKYGASGFQKAAYSGDEDEIYDDKQLKVDRTDKFLKQTNAVGVITDAPMDSFDGYASAVLISPCHVLVNAHAVTRRDARLGKENVYISLGQNNCNSKNEFLHQDMPGKVIAIFIQIADSNYLSGHILV